MSSPSPTGPNESRFAHVLRERMDAYFIERGLSPYADPMMHRKIALGIAGWVAGLLVLYAAPLHGWQVLLAYLALALPQSFLLLNVAHDAIHGAISSRRWVNRLLSLVYDGCGVSSYLVRILHNQGHHATINLHGQDDPLEGRHVLRFTRDVPWRPWHHAQHLYGPLLYPLLSLDYVFLRDFEDFFRPTLAHLRRRRHRARQWLILFGGKLAYLGVMLGVPIFWLGYPALAVVAGFLLMHLVIGLLVAAVFAPTHLLGCNVFPRSGDEFPDYVHHIFATTCDFAPQSRVVTWLTGGLNHHIVHHIRPQVCHVHYPALTRIAQQTAAEFGVAYRALPTMRGALLAHHAWLREMARAA